MYTTRTMELKQTVECGGKSIEATVTSSGAKIASWIRNVSSAYANTTKTVIIGLATESKPNRKHKKTNNHDVGTLQLCVWNKCLIIQLAHVDHIPRALTKLLFNTRHVFVGVDVEADVARLEAGEHGSDLVCRERCDVRSVVMDKWQEKGGLKSTCPDLKELALAVARLALPDWPKSVAKSDWLAGTLTQQQVEFACVRAYACFRIGMKLRMLELI